MPQVFNNFKVAPNPSTDKTCKATCQLTIEVKSNLAPVQIVAPTYA